MQNDSVVMKKMSKHQKTGSNGFEQPGGFLELL